MVPVIVPRAAGLDELPRLEGGRRADHGHQLAVAADLDPQDAEAGLGAVEGDALDQPGEGFTVLGGGVGAEWRDCNEGCEDVCG